MQVKAIRWVGARTDGFEAMRPFLTDALGLAPVFDGEDVLVADAANGDRFELFGPGAPHPPWSFQGTRTMVSFLVDDIRAASEELRGRGVELLGDLEALENGYAWQHFRAPDGTVYALTEDPRVA